MSDRGRVSDDMPVYAVGVNAKVDKWYLIHYTKPDEIIPDHYLIQINEFVLTFGEFREAARQAEATAAIRKGAK